MATDLDEGRVQFEERSRDLEGSQGRMGKCEVCGNEYALAFQVITAGQAHVFDSFECAIQRLAPVCEHCQCKILGHGIEAEGRFFCCAHCAREMGFTGPVDNA
jgi:hypothetical protein